MAIKYDQNGKLKTVVAVHRIAMVLEDEWGYWESAPIDKVNSNTDLTKFFQTQNKGSYMLGPKGYVKYETADGAVFTMSFSCPTSTANVCNGEVSTGTPYTIQSYVPSSGYNIDYEWTIQRKSFGFFDAPVFSSDLLAAERCDLVSTEKIVEAIDGRDCIYLRDVFAVADLPDEAKLWCATHDLFLTADSKAMLTRELAETVLGEKSTGEVSSDLVDRALEHNTATAEGDGSEATGSALRTEFAALALKQQSNGGSVRERELDTAVAALVLDDLAYGWRVAVEAYVGEAGSAGVDERRRLLVNLLEERL